MKFTDSTTFLDALEPKGQFTFQTFPDNRSLGDKSLIKVLHGTFLEHQSKLERLNKEGAGIFVTVNRTDLKGRKAENITGIRAIFLDLDGAPLPEDWPLQPHLIIESSPGKYHVYWRVQPGFPLEIFGSVQKVVAEKFGGDQVVIDLPRVLRVPGFDHCKGKPFRVRIIPDLSKGACYTQEEILAAFPIEKPVSQKPVLAEINDPLLITLRDQGLLLGEGRDSGMYRIVCPWSSAHTNGDAESVVFLPNYGGYVTHGFKCFHSHCLNRSIKDLREFLGVKDNIRSRPVLRKISSIETMPTQWLMEGYLPLAALVLLDGDPGLGKSFITQFIAARVSSGEPFPSGDSPSPSGVVLLSLEDDPARTIRPRLEAMGADLDRIILLEGLQTDNDTPKLPTIADIEAIKMAMEECRARLVIIDPLMAALPGKIDSHSDHNIRRVLAPLSKLAQDSGATILVVRHINKGGGGNALYRGGGSIGIVAAARAAFLVGKDPGDEKRRILAPTKMNLAKEPRSLVYRIQVNEEGQPIVCWEGESELTAHELLEPDGRKNRSSPSLEEAKDFLRERLKKGPVRCDQIESESKERGISEATLRRAKEGIGVQAKRGKAGWFLTLKVERPMAQKDLECPPSKNAPAPSKDDEQVARKALGTKNDQLAHDSGNYMSTLPESSKKPSGTEGATSPEKDRSKDSSENPETACREGNFKDAHEKQPDIAHGPEDAHLNPGDELLPGALKIEDNRSSCSHTLDGAGHALEDTFSREKSEGGDPPGAPDLNGENSGVLPDPIRTWSKADEGKMITWKDKYPGPHSAKVINVENGQPVVIHPLLEDPYTVQPGWILAVDGKRFEMLKKEEDKSPSSDRQAAIVRRIRRLRGID